MTYDDGDTRKSIIASTLQFNHPTAKRTLPPQSPTSLSHSTFFRPNNAMAKRAVLIGCNYPGTQAELRGCVNDVWRVRENLIKRFGFSEENISVMIDTDPSFAQPTWKAIQFALSKLADSAETGDPFFVHFSGHGVRFPSAKPEEDDTGFDECLLTSDFIFITDDDCRQFINRFPEGCKVTFVADCCHSGGLIEKAKEQIGDSTKKGRSCFESIIKRFTTKPVMPHDDKERDDQLCHGHYNYVKDRSLPVEILIDILKEKTGLDDINVENLTTIMSSLVGKDCRPEVNNFKRFGLDTLQDGGGENGEQDRGSGLSRMLAILTERSFPDSGILLSACQSGEKAQEVDFENSGKVYGAFSSVVLTVLEKSKDDVTHREVVNKARKLLKSQGFTQRPGLYCSDVNVDARFLF